MTKAQRQHRIAQLLGQRRVGSQAELVALLRDEGIAATQATVSRDLLELGAVKQRGPDGARTLALQDTAPPPGATDHLHRVLAEWVVEVKSAGQLVVVKTPPGCAHVVASALDRAGLASALGTVAGDDTIFVAVDDAVRGATLARRLRELGGISPARAGRDGARRARSGRTA